MAGGHRCHGENRKGPGERLGEKGAAVEPERRREVGAEDSQSRHARIAGPAPGQPPAGEQRGEGEGQGEESEKDVRSCARGQQLLEPDQRCGQHRQAERMAEHLAIPHPDQVVVQLGSSAFLAGRGRALRNLLVVVPEIEVAIDRDRVRHQRKVWLIPTDQRGSDGERKDVEQEEPNPETGREPEPRRHGLFGLCRGHLQPPDRV